MLLMKEFYSRQLVDKHIVYMQCAHEERGNSLTSYVDKRRWVGSPKMSTFCQPYQVENVNEMRVGGKCFTHVTKTCANLTITTYSRKPENYNGTIIFEIDIMKNSSPIDFFTNFCVVSFILIYSVTLRS